MNNIKTNDIKNKKSIIDIMSSKYTIKYSNKPPIYYSNIHYSLDNKICSGCGNKLKLNNKWYFVNDSIYCNKLEAIEKEKEYNRYL